MKHILLYIFALLPLLANAEKVREITISADKPYTDNFTLAHEAGDMDVMIKFSFDEQNNQVTVSMTSYRGLFVFQQNALYKKVVRFSKLRMNKLSYLIEGDKVSYKLPNKFKKQLGKDYKNFVFQRWLNYTGLLPEPVDYMMVNDVLEQKFGVVGDKRKSVTVTIGDVMIMEPKVNICKKTYYNFLQFARVDTKYIITIQRDPCFGMEEKISIATQQKTALEQALEGLKTTFPDRTIKTKEIYDLYTKTKEMLVQQYPKRDTVSDCPDLQALNDSFNVIVDSVHAYKCVLSVSNDSAREMPNPAYLLAAAYQIDMKVSRWLLTTDPLERIDIIKYCNDKIADANLYVKRVGVRSKDMRDAYAVLQKAISYYQSTCHIRK